MTKNKRSVSKSINEYGRGITGGLLFSFPVLYTMEVWWAGFSATSIQLILLICVTFLLLLGYNRFAGMRAGTSWRSILIDSVEEMGIGLVLSFFVLLLLNRIRLEEMPLEEMMGKTIIEAMAVSIGVSIGTAQLGVSSEDDESMSLDDLESESWWATRKALFVLGLCGAIIVGGNVAPTEEVVMLAIQATPVHILLMSLASLLFAVIAVYFSDFKGHLYKKPGSFSYTIVSDICISYVTALLASAFCLWFFGRFNNVSFYVAFAQCVVLGVISSLGASAGRILIR